MVTLISTVYFSCIFTLGLYFFILAGANIAEIRRYTRHPALNDGPLVSVLIPVRNEAAHIQRCLDSLRHQTYPHYEILVLDDDSQDDTGVILEQAAKADPRIRVFSGAPLPADWYGKPYALQQLAGYACGEILIMTDADTVHSPSSIAFTVTNMAEADFISGYVGQELRSFGEKITVPLMFFLTGFVIPLCLNRYTKWSAFSVAIGQFIAIRKEVFSRIGGFTRVRKRTSEDIYLARLVKARGFTTRFLDLGDQVRCRMYVGYRSAMNGIGKNIFDFLGNHSAVLILVFWAVFFFLFLPFPLALALPWTLPTYRFQLLGTNLLYTLTWTMLFVDRRLPWYYGLLWPLMMGNLLVTALWSWVRAVSGRGFTWKGRIVG
ncbi:MAG: glycosyltransferase [Spirochaetaceae bacterium]|jgi:chlorobactene glucosyltransferase|nr:glycosyltransferase [Spirochaetaceae bacterium]